MEEIPSIDPAPSWAWVTASLWRSSRVSVPWVRVLTQNSNSSSSYSQYLWTRARIRVLIHTRKSEVKWFQYEVSTWCSDGPWPVLSQNHIYMSDITPDPTVVEQLKPPFRTVKNQNCSWQASPASWQGPISSLCRCAPLVYMHACVRANWLFLMYITFVKHCTNLCQRPFQEPQLKVPTIYKAYVRGYNQKIYKHMTLYMVQYLQFRILKFPSTIHATGHHWVSQFGLHIAFTVESSLHFNLLGFGCAGKHFNPLQEDVLQGIRQIKFFFKIYQTQMPC